MPVILRNFRDLEGGIGAASDVFDELAEAVARQ